MIDFSTHVSLIINLDFRLKERVRRLISVKMPQEVAEKNSLLSLNDKQIQLAAEKYNFIGEYLSAFAEYLQLKNALKEIVNRQLIVNEQSKFATEQVDKINADLEKWWRDIEALTSKWSDTWKEHKEKYKSAIIKLLKKQKIEIEKQLTETEFMTRDELIKIVNEASVNGKL